MTNLKYRHGGTFMFKKIFSFLISFFCFSTSCHGVLMEILDGDFSFVVDTEAKTAVVRFVYIPAHTKKDIKIPEYVTDFRGDKYLPTRHAALCNALSHLSLVLISLRCIYMPETGFQGETYVLACRLSA